MAKKIALVYDAIYPYTKGGGEKRYYEIAKRLAIKGYEVHLYGMKSWDGPDVIQKEGLYLHGICPSKPLYTKDGRRSIWQALYFGINCLKLIKGDFDIIDCCGFPYFSLFTVKIVCLLKGKKLDSTWHEVWGRDYWQKYLGALWIFGYLVEIISAQLPDKIIAVSKTTARRIRNELHYKKNIEVVPNGIDLKAINNISPSKIQSDVIYAGRLMNFKNVDVLIKSVNLLRNENPLIKCLIVGDGPEKAKLLALSHKLKVDRNIKFTGFLSKQDDIYSLMKSSKVFVLPSIREGFGIVILEANACGIPVITVKNKNNAATELIKENKNGHVTNLNEKYLQVKIIRAIKMGKKMNTACLDLVNTYDWNKIVNHLERIYFI